MHLLSGPVDTSALSAEAPAKGELSVAESYRALQQRIDALEAEVASQKAALTEVMKQLGINV